MAQPTIQEPGLSTKLFSALGIKGKTSAPNLGDLVHPVVIVEDVSRESWYTATADRAGVYGGSLTAGAAQFPVVQLFNPAGSGTLAILDRFYVGAGNTAQWQLLEANAALPTVFNLPAFRDTRLPGNPTILGLTDVPAAIPGFNLIAAGRAGTTTTQQVEIGYVFGPGTGINLALNLVTGTLDWVFCWRERSLFGTPV